MASAAVFWNYQGKLNMTGAQNEERRRSVDGKVQRAGRKESECSVTSYTNEAEDQERRVSATSAGGDSTDDEALDHSQDKSKDKRRFSLDFLFSRKSRDKREKRQKSKRSQSNTTDVSNNFVAYRYPGFTGAEFALAI